MIVWKIFGIVIDKNVVYRCSRDTTSNKPGGGGPSWLTFIGLVRRIHGLRFEVGRGNQFQHRKIL